MQAGRPSDDFEKSAGECGEEHVPNLVADSLSEVKDYKI